jgi:hypothetical protein
VFQKLQKRALLGRRSAGFHATIQLFHHCDVAVEFLARLDYRGSAFASTLPDRAGLIAFRAISFSSLLYRIPYASAGPSHIV